MKSSTNKMRNFKHSFFYALLIMLNYSCALDKTSQSDLTDIVIDPSNVQGAFDVADYVSDEFEIIPLETTDESLIAQIDKVIYQNGIYYVLDTQTHTVFLFDSQGKYMNKLYKKGEGPDEYSRLNSCVVIGRDVWVSDASQQLLIGYDNNFNMLKKINLWDVIAAYDMVAMNNRLYMTSNWKGWNETNMQLASYDLNNGEINGLVYVPKQPEGIPVFRKVSQLSVSGDSCLFLYGYCDSIFMIKNAIAIPKYQIVFTERYKDIPYTAKDRYMNPNYKHIIKGIEDIKQIKNFIFLEYIDNDKFITAAYDSDKNIAQLYHNLTNSYLGINIYQHSMYLTDEYIISSYEPSVILEDKQRFIPDMNQIKNEADRKKIEQLLAGLAPEDNPVLVKFKFK